MNEILEIFICFGFDQVNDDMNHNLRYNNGEATMFSQWKKNIEKLSLYSSNGYHDAARLISLTSHHIVLILFHTFMLTMNLWTLAGSLWTVNTEDRSESMEIRRFY